MSGSGEIAAASKVRWLLACGIIAGPLFVAVWLVEGALRPDYHPLRHPISALSLGAGGWRQVANFLLTGALVICCAAGLWRTLRAERPFTWGALLIGVVGVGLIGAGLFPTDPALGYPPGTRPQVEYTAVGIVHFLFSLPVFLALPGACFLFARHFARRRMVGRALYSLASGIGMFVAFCLAVVGFSGDTGLVEYGGLFQRVSLVVGLGWLMVVAGWGRFKRLNLVSDLT